MCAEMHAETHAALCCAVLPALLQGLKRAELRDELYMQLVKQTRSNPVATSRARAWALFHLVASAMPPSKEFTGLISEYVHTALQVSESIGRTSVGCRLWVGRSGSGQVAGLPCVGVQQPALTAVQCWTCMHEPWLCLCVGNHCAREHRAVWIARANGSRVGLGKYTPVALAGAPGCAGHG